MTKEITSLRPKLRAWAEKQPEHVKIRAGFVDKNLKELAKAPDNTAAFDALRKNHAALLGMISALSSEQREKSTT